MTRHDAPESDSPDSDSADSTIAPLERAIVLALTLPFEIGARIVESAPGIEKARQQIVLARFVGKLAVDSGARELRQRLMGQDEVPSSEAREKASRAEPDNLAVTPGATSVPSEVSGSPDHSPDQESLALPDYDQLPAAHVVAKLPGLSRTERDEIESYETNGRHRRTVLGKLGQLRADEAEG